MLLLWNVRRYYYDRYDSRYEWGEDTQMDMIFTPVRYAQRVIRFGRGNEQQIVIDDIPLPLDYHAGTLGVSRMDRNKSWHYELKEKLEQFMDGYRELRESIEKDGMVTDDLKLQSHIREKLTEKDPELIEALMGVSSSPVHFCKDTSCNHILESDEEICPNSLDHAGWQEEGVLNAVLEEMKRRSKDKSIGQEIEIILNKTINEKKKYIIDNAPLSLLTTGWGQEEDKRQKIQGTKYKHR